MNAFPVIAILLFISGGFLIANRRRNRSYGNYVRRRSQVITDAANAEEDAFRRAIHG